MQMHRITMAGLAVAVTMWGCAQQQQAQTSGLEGVANAMGATNLNSIEYEGSGSLYGFGQAYIPGEEWPRFVQRSYVMQINYQTPAMRLNTVRSQGEHPPRGGAAQPVAADQRTINVVSGKNAWGEAGQQANPNNEAAGDRLRALWATPHGVIKGAMANSGMLNGKEITFSADGREMKATLNDQNLVETVTYQLSSEVVGDYPVEVTYSDYADYNGVKFPKHIVQKEDGFPTLDIMINAVRPNAPVQIDVPANVASAPAAPAAIEVTSDKLADGVWYMHAQGVHSWAVEFRDYIVAVEGIASDARSVAVNEEIHKLIPNKPIRYVVNTHAHYDHAGGLRTYVAQGTTIVTQEANKAFFEKVWARPHTIAPDTLQKEPKAPVFDTVAEKKVLTDGRKTIEIYHMKNSGHNQNNLIVYMPREGLIYWGDGYNPPAGESPIDPARTPEYGIDLYRNIMDLKLNVKTIAPAHGAGAKPFDNLKKAIGVMTP
jgi:glyoxylase-like metal-dependent hydrolase (beta-lactamase superfamily II)